MTLMTHIFLNESDKRFKRQKKNVSRMSLSILYYHNEIAHQ